MSREQVERLEAAITKYNERAGEKIYWWDIIAKLEDWSNSAEVLEAIEMVERKAATI